MFWRLRLLFKAQIPTGDDAQNDEETKDTNYDTGSEHKDAEIYTAECRENSEIKN